MSYDTRDEILDLLKGAWGLEKNCVEMLGGSADHVADATLGSLLLRHRDICHTSEEMLEARIRSLGGEPSGVSGFISKAASTLTGWLESIHGRGGRDRDAALRDYVMLATRAATYRSLEARAIALGDQETAALAHTWSDQGRSLMDETFDLIGRVGVEGRAAQPRLAPDEEVRAARPVGGEVSESPQVRPPSPPLL